MDKRTSWASLVLESSDDEHVEETPIKRLHRVVESSDDEKESNSEHENVEQSQYDSTLPFEDYDDAVSSTVCVTMSPNIHILLLQSRGGAMIVSLLSRWLWLSCLMYIMSVVIGGTVWVV